MSVRVQSYAGAQSHVYANGIERAYVCRTRVRTSIVEP